MSLVRKNLRKLSVMLDKKTNPNSKSICKHITRPSQLIKDHTGSGEDYTDTYYYCSKLKKRITKKTCHTCRLYEKFTYPN